MNHSYFSGFKNLPNIKLFIIIFAFMAFSSESSQVSTKSSAKGEVSASVSVIDPGGPGFEAATNGLRDHERQGAVLPRPRGQHPGAHLPRSYVDVDERW